MDEQGTNPLDKPEPSTELRPLDHDGFFTNTFQMKRLAKGFLRVTLPGGLRERLDLDGLTLEPLHLTDDVFKKRRADVIYRVPIKESEHHVDFFVILEHKSFNYLWTIFQLWQYVARVLRQEFKKADEAGLTTADYQLPPVIAIIVHHGETRFTGKTELSELFLKLPGIEKYLPRLQAVLFDLNAIVRLMYSRQDQWREDALLIMFGCNKPWSFDRPPYLRGKLMKRVTSSAKQLPGQRRTQMRLLNRGSPSR